ncbi:MAG: GNAT family N-acetyltransferase [Candidatus Thermoplasmatota archaeon]|nr:GNAT family N-acetyltransferase [Candidatus Thermoplasmatota archaeon]
MRTVAEDDAKSTCDVCRDTGINVRIASIRDLQELENIERSCFEYGRYSSSVLRGFLLHPFSITYVAEMEKRIVASEIIFLHRKSVEVASLAVMPEVRGRGFGKVLLRKAEDMARRHAIKLLTLHVDVNNLSAIGLYKKEGYLICERITEYYGKGKDAFYLTKNIE